MNEDEMIRDMMINSAAQFDACNCDGGPTILTLYDTVKVLSDKNPEWRKDRLCRMIFAWQAANYLESHAEEVCKAKCPELIGLCQEYRQLKTMMGLSLSPLFGMSALNYISSPLFGMSALNEDVEYEGFGFAPVRDCYFKITDQKDAEI